MGLYQRDYGREPTPWERRENPPSVVIPLIVANVIVFVAQLLFNDNVINPETGSVIRNPTTGQLLKECALYEWFGLTAESLYKPWLWFQLFTYGFLHDSNGPWPMHLAFNMLGLFFFGRAIERALGPMEFLRFYLIAIVFCGIIGAVNSIIVTQVFGGPPSLTIGASGGVLATVILFAFHYPHQHIYLMMVLPVKAWIAAIAFVGMDLMGALGISKGMGGSNVAFIVHLAGAAFAALYFRRRWNFEFLEFDGIREIPRKLRMRARRAKLKIHDPDKKIADEDAKADQLLAKIHEFGEASLTKAERKIMERHSRRQRSKRDQ